MKKIISLLTASIMLLAATGAVSASGDEIVNWADKTVYSSVSGSCAYDVKNSKNTIDALFGLSGTDVANSSYNVELGYPVTYDDEKGTTNVGTVPISKFLVDLGEERDINYIDIYQYKDRITKIKVYEVTDASKFNAAKNTAASISDSFMSGSHMTFLGEATFDNGGNAATTLNELGNCTSPDRIVFSETKNARYLFFAITETVSTLGYSKILLQKIAVNKGTPPAVTPDTPPEDEPEDSPLEELTARPIFRDKHNTAYSKGATELTANCMDGTELEALTDLTDTTGVEVQSGDSLVVDMGMEKVINLISITQLGNAIDEFEVHYSSNNEEWQIFAEESFEELSLNFDDAQPIEKSIEREAVICRYIKLNVKTLREDALVSVPSLLSFEAYNTEGGTEVNVANADVRSDVTGLKNTREDATYGYMKNALSPNKQGYTMLGLRRGDVLNTFFAIDLGRITEINRIQLLQRKENIIDYSVYICDTDAQWNSVSAFKSTEKGVDAEVLESLTKVADGTLPILEEYDTIQNYDEEKEKQITDFVSVVDFEETVKCRYLVFVITKVVNGNGGPMQWEIEAYNNKIVPPIYFPDGNESEFDASLMGENYALGKSVLSDAEYIEDNAAYTDTQILTDEEKSDGKNIFYLGGKIPSMVIDFQEAVPTNTLVLYEYGKRLTDVTLYCSNDNENWELVKNHTQNKIDGRTPVYTEISYPLTVARYMKIISNNQQGMAMLSEVESYCSIENAVILNKLTADLLTDEQPEYITNDLIDLPDRITDDENNLAAGIEWSDGGGAVIPQTGVVTRDFNEDKKVLLTAKLTLDGTGEIFYKSFNLCVKQDLSGNLVSQKELIPADYQQMGSVSGDSILSLGENSSASYTYSEENNFLIKDNFTVEFQLDTACSFAQINIDTDTLSISRANEKTIFTLGSKQLLELSAPDNAKYKLEFIDGTLNIYIDKLNGYGYRSALYNLPLTNAIFRSIEFSTQNGEAAEISMVKLSIPEKKLIDTVLEQFAFSKLTDDNPLSLTKNLTKISSALKTDITYSVSGEDSAINPESLSVDLNRHGIFPINVNVTYNGITKSKPFRTAVGNILAGNPVNASAIPYSETSVESITAAQNEGYYLTTSAKYTITAELPELKPVTKVVISEPPAMENVIHGWSISISADGKTYEQVASGTSVGKELSVDFPPVKAKKIMLSVTDRSGNVSGIEKMLAFFVPTALQIVQSDNALLSFPEEISGTTTLPLTGEYGATHTYEITEPANSTILNISLSGGCYVCMVNKPDNDTAVQIKITTSLNGESVSRMVSTKVCGKNSVSTTPSDEGTINAGNSGYGGGGGGGTGVSYGNTPTVPQTASPESRFPEIENHWAKAEITALVNKGIVKGDGSSLNLASNITRAEYIAMLVRAMNWTLSTYSSSFADVSSNDWYAQIIQTAYEKGVFKGDGTNAMPQMNISRQEAAVMLANICDTTKNTGQDFVDSDLISQWAREGISKAAALGLIKGYEDGTFAPLASIRRDEAMVVIYRLLALQYRR